MDKITNIFSKFLPIYWAFLTYMLLRPGVENKEFAFMFPGIDKLIHLFIFSMLGLCFRCAYPHTRLLTYLYIMLIYAFLTEILQGVMNLGRSAETLDIVADTVGVLIGWYIFGAARKRFT